MRLASFIFAVFIAQFGWSQLDSIQISEKREAHLSELMDVKAGVLDSTEIAHFQGLDYFDFDAQYQINARFEKNIGKKFKMPTSTDRLPTYRRYGYVYFQLDSTELRLTVYQNMGLRKVEGFKNYLFIPFRDLTNSSETYGGGRYLDVEIPEGEVLPLDFNTAYNPYCAYSVRYSCPIPPAENRIEVEVLAGEKLPVGHD